MSVENISKSENGLENILNICVSALDNIARSEKKYSRGNNMALMNQTLKKIQIKRSFEKFIRTISNFEQLLNLYYLTKLSQATTYI